MSQAYSKGTYCAAEAYRRLCYNHVMLISEAGEFGLIDAITRLIDHKEKKDLPCRKNLIISTGDDTAAWQQTNGIELATTDTMVEGIHFDLSKISWKELGWKSVAVNISDIAAMGGQPCYALISLSLPAYHRVEDILNMYKGMLEICNKYGVAIAGGNISAAPQISINIALTGICHQPPLRRCTAKAGDLIAITGYPGLARAGLQAVTSLSTLPARITRLLRNAHFHPIPQVETGKKLSMLGVKTAIDTSDGLLADLGHICKCSRKSAIIYSESLPVHPALKRYFPQDYLKFALAGGEDYALLFTADSQIMQKVKSELNTAITLIGEITPAKTGKIIVLDGHGKPVKINTAGWDHYNH